MFTRPLTTALAFAALLCCHGIARAQPVPSAAAPEGSSLAERFIRPASGAVALVFNENGDVIAVTRDGHVLPSCQVCTPELERIYGPKCTRARKLSDFHAPAASRKPVTTDDKAAAAPPLICDKLMNTNVQGVTPVSAVRHTGSQCMSFFLNSDGQAKVYQYCW